MQLIESVNKRNYELESMKFLLTGRKVRDHPLQNEEG